MCDPLNGVSGTRQPSLSSVRWLRGPEGGTLRMTQGTKPTQSSQQLHQLHPVAAGCGGGRRPWCAASRPRGGDRLHGCPSRALDGGFVHSGGSSPSFLGVAPKLTGAPPFPLPLHDRVGAGRPSGSSETHFRTGIDSDLTSTTTHTHTHASFPWKRSSGKFPPCQEAEL